MKSISVALADLTPDPENLRKHPPRNIEAIAASLRRFGQQRPILVERNGIIRAGNGTYAAALSLGWTHIDVVYTELTGADAAAFAIAANRTAELAAWDEEVLALSLRSLVAEGIDLSTTGFTFEELAALAPVAPVGLPAEPEAQRSTQVFRFNLIFDTLEQQTRWFNFVRRVNLDTPERGTFAARLDDFLLNGNYQAA